MIKTYFENMGQASPPCVHITCALCYSSVLTPDTRLTAASVRERFIVHTYMASAVLAR